MVKAELGGIATIPVSLVVMAATEVTQGLTGMVGTVAPAAKERPAQMGTTSWRAARLPLLISMVPRLS